jgi:isocitrate dehydrogenase (NAD+)
VLVHAVSYKGNPLNFIRRGVGDEIEEPMVDVVIFRQNTEGLYGGVEWSVILQKTSIKAL